MHHLRPLIILFILLLTACGGGGSNPTPSNGTTPAAAVAARSSDLAPDDTCPNGGILVQTGLDLNGNGVLDDDEVRGEEPVCHGRDGRDGRNGSDGADGLSALVSTEPVSPGTDCPAGGLRIRTGLDVDGDDNLDAGEVEKTTLLCNGQSGDDGLTTLVQQETLAPGSECPAGGLTIRSGPDRNGDGSLAADEVTQESRLCLPVAREWGWQPATLAETDDPHVPRGIHMSGTDVIIPPSLTPVSWLQAAWVDKHWSGDRLWVNTLRPRRYTEGKWEVPRLLYEASSSGEVIQSATIRTAIAANGWAAVAFVLRNNDTADRLLVFTYDPNTGWNASPTEIDSGKKIEKIDLAMNDDGHAVLLWSHDDGSSTTIRTARRSPTSSWNAAPETLETVSRSSLVLKLSEMNSNGELLAIWTTGSDHSVLRGARFTLSGGGWQAPSTLNTGLSGWVYGRADLALSENGDALVVWAQQANVLHYNRYDAAAAAWSGPRVLANTKTTAPRPSVAIDDNGNALAAWRGPDAAFADFYGVWASRYDATAGSWTTEKRLDREPGFLGIPVTLMNGKGNGLVMWARFRDNEFWSFTMETAQYASVGGWVASRLGEPDWRATEYRGNGFSYYALQAYLSDHEKAVFLANLERYPRPVLFAQHFLLQVPGSPFLSSPKGWIGLWTVGEVELDVGPVYQEVELAMDQRGDALALWMQVDGDRAMVWTNRYQRETGWGTAQTLYQGDTEAYPPMIRLAMERSQGLAVAAWLQKTASSDRAVMIRRFDPVTGWGELLMASPDGLRVEKFDIAIDETGGVHLLWADYDDSNPAEPQFRLMARHLPAGSNSWSAPERITSRTAVLFSSVSSVKLATTANGTLAAAWVMDGDLKVLLKDAGTTSWSSPKHVGNALDGELAFAPDGRLWVVWAYDGAVMAQSFDADAWGTIQILNPTGQQPYDPRLGIDASGNVFVVWQEMQDGRGHVWGNRYEVGTGWGTPTLLERENAGRVAAHDLAVAQSGTALAVWLQSDGMNENRWYVTGTAYRPGAGWGPPQRLDDRSFLIRFTWGATAVGIGDNGAGLAIWKGGVTDEIRAIDLWSSEWIGP